MTKFWSQSISVKAAFLVVLILSLGTSPDIFLDQRDDRNLFLIMVMVFATAIYFLTFKIRRSEFIWWGFILSTFFSAFFINSESARLSTLIYTCFFVFTFLTFRRGLERKWLSLTSYIEVVRALMLLFFGVFLIQQSCVLLGLPVFLAGNYNPDTPWKLSSIAAEPSHASLVLAVAFYSYLSCMEICRDDKKTRNNKLIAGVTLWLLFIWWTITSGSATATIGAILVSSKFLRLKSILFIAGLLVVASTIIVNFEIAAFDRIKLFLAAVLSMDAAQIIAADHSGSYRIVPALLIAAKVSVLSVEGLFGHGIDYVASFLYLEMPGTPEGFSTGGIMTLWLEFGFLSFMLFVFAVLRAAYVRGNFLQLVFLFVALFFGNGINTQVVWIYICLLHANQWFHTTEAKKLRRSKFQKIGISESQSLDRFAVH